MMRFIVHIKSFYGTKVCIICNKTNFLLIIFTCGLLLPVVDDLLKVFL
jgi:hypothetical protein